MEALPKPDWLRRSLSTGKPFIELKENITKNKLATVCEEAHCPNISECWNGGTATVMVMGDTCTRGCKFCAVKTARNPLPLDPEEPRNLAASVKETGQFDYIVVTSVDRDDLEDQGSNHFAECIRELKRQIPGIIVEVLIPDFQGRKDLLQNVVEAKPDVIAHNIETTRRLQLEVRDPRAGYEQSLRVLQNVKKANPGIFTKSSIMLGLGETQEEVIQTMRDLRAIDVDIFTLGQYLKPRTKFLKVKEYVPPSRFDWYKAKGEELGFRFVASGPFVRSSYKAGELFVKNILDKRRGGASAT